MTGQLPLTITELLIQCIPAPGATSHEPRGCDSDDAHIQTPACLRESRGRHPHSRTYRQRRPPPPQFLVLLFPLDILSKQIPLLSKSRLVTNATTTCSCSSAHWRSSARSTSLGGLPMRLFPAHGSTSGGEIRKLRSEGEGGRATRRSRSRRPSQRRRTDLGEARLAGRGPIPYAHRGKHAG